MYSNNPHTDLDACKKLAVVKSVEHKVNYNVIILNPNEKGEFDFACGSTYEIVADSYFQKERNNVKKLTDTNELCKPQKINS